MSSLGTLAMLLIAFLVAPYVDRRGKALEVGLTRWVAIVYVVIAAGATVYRLLEFAMSPGLRISMPVQGFWPLWAGLGLSARAQIFKRGTQNIKRHVRADLVARGEPEESAGIQCHLGQLFETKSMTLVELSERVGISVVNLSVLKNNRAKAIRFSTLQASCVALDCEVGELLSYAPVS